MIIRKTERLYMERNKQWFKHGSWSKDLTTQVTKRTTWWLLFIPVFYYEKIVKSDLV